MHLELIKSNVIGRFIIASFSYVATPTSPTSPCLLPFFLLLHMSLQFDLSTIGPDSMNKQFILCIRTERETRRRMKETHDKQRRRLATVHTFVDTGVTIFMTGGCSLVGSSSDFFAAENADYTIYDVRLYWDCSALWNTFRVMHRRCDPYLHALPLSVLCTIKHIKPVYPPPTPPWMSNLSPFSWICQRSVLLDLLSPG